MKKEKKKNKKGDLISGERIELATLVDSDPKAPFFNSYLTDVLGRVLLHTLGYSTLLLILTLSCWVLSNAESSTIFWVFGMTRPRNETLSPEPLAHKEKEEKIRKSMVGVKKGVLANVGSMAQFTWSWVEEPHS